MTNLGLGRIPACVRAVFFDAVGTVIHPQPSAGDAYALFGKQFGSRLEQAEIVRRFSRAFQHEEEEDARQGYRTNEQREVQRWTRIVAAVLDDVTDRGACFSALYEHFAQPAAWRADEQAAKVISTLQRAGYTVGLATNFDRRLPRVLAGFAEFNQVSLVVISSEVGWKKPAQEFFRYLCRQTGLSPGEVMLVGDDAENDHLGAMAAGLQSLLLDPREQARIPAEQRLRTLSELLGKVLPVEAATHQRRGY